MLCPSKHSFIIITYGVPPLSGSGCDTLRECLLFTKGTVEIRPHTLWVFKTRSLNGIDRDDI